jgi:hypothetical protein
MEKASLFYVKLHAIPRRLSPGSCVDRETEALRGTAVRHRAQEGNRKADAGNRANAVIVYPVPLRGSPPCIEVSLRGRLLIFCRLVRRSTGTNSLADLFLLLRRQHLKNLTVLNPGVPENHGIFLICS